MKWNKILYTTFSFYYAQQLLALLHAVVLFTVLRPPCARKTKKKKKTEWNEILKNSQKFNSRTCDCESSRADANFRVRALIFRNLLSNTTGTAKLPCDPLSRNSNFGQGKRLFRRGIVAGAIRQKARAPTRRNDLWGATVSRIKLEKLNNAEDGRGNSPLPLPLLFRPHQLYPVLSSSTISATRAKHQNTYSSIRQASRALVCLVKDRAGRNLWKDACNQGPGPGNTKLLARRTNLRN